MHLQLHVLEEAVRLSATPRSTLPTDPPARAALYSVGAWIGCIPCCNPGQDLGDLLRTAVADFADCAKALPGGLSMSLRAKGKSPKGGIPQRGNSPKGEFSKGKIPKRGNLPKGKFPKGEVP